MVKVYFFNAGHRPALFHFNSHYSGCSPTRVEIRLICLYFQAQWINGQRTNRTEYFRERWSLLMPPYSKEIALPEGV